MNKIVHEKAKDLITECHEHGLVACIGIADKKDGDSIRSMDGQISDVLLLIATLIVQLEAKSGFSSEEMADSIYDAIKRIKKANV